MSTAVASTSSDGTKLGRVIAQLSQFRISPMAPKSTLGGHGSKSDLIPIAVDLTDSSDDEPRVASTETDVGSNSLPQSTPRHQQIVEILRDAKRRRLEKSPPKIEEPAVPQTHPKGPEKPDNPYVLPESAPSMF